MICASPPIRAVSSRASVRRPVMTTAKPLRPSARADARPIPLPPPVTIATLLIGLVPLVQLLGLHQPTCEAEALQVQDRRQRLQWWAWDGDRFATLDVVDDVAD